MVDTSVLQYYMGETNIERWIVRDSWKGCFNSREPCTTPSPPPPFPHPFRPSFWTYYKMGVTAEYPAILRLYPHNCGYVATRLRGYAAKWLRGYVATWLSG